MTNQVLNQSVFNGQPEKYKWATFCAKSRQVRLRQNEPVADSHGKLQRTWIGIAIDFAWSPYTDTLTDEVLEREEPVCGTVAPERPTLSAALVQEVPMAPPAGWAPAPAVRHQAGCTEKCSTIGCPCNERSKQVEPPSVDDRIAQLEELLAKYRESDKRMRFGIALLCDADVINLGAGARMLGLAVE